MIPLRNFTLHVQGELERALAGQAGFLLQSDPEGFVLQPAGEALTISAARLAIRLRASADQGEAVLIGGHTALWILAVAELLAVPKTIPTLCYFETERVRDEFDRFIFVPKALLQVPPFPTPITQSR